MVSIASIPKAPFYKRSRKQGVVRDKFKVLPSNSCFDYADSPNRPVRPAPSNRHTREYVNERIERSVFERDVDVVLYSPIQTAERKLTSRVGLDLRLDLVQSSASSIVSSIFIQG